MRVVPIIIIICASRCASLSNPSCGIEMPYFEDNPRIETYPWLGLLIYANADEKPLTATVVLITKVMAIATALEIDKFPKHNFRRMARVVLGRNCSGPYIRVLEYVFHPEYRRNYYSALAMIQLKGSRYLANAVPICAPSKYFEEPDIFAITLTHDCTSSMVRLYRMQYVSLDECKDYYRRNDLDVESLWPKHVACAQSVEGGNCLWRSGTVLTTIQNGQWHLLGVGVYGPGCEAPARFLDYSNYHDWVQNSQSTIGKVSLTRMAPNHIILRRSGWKIQRWGPCDKEEHEYEIYSDYTTILPHKSYLDKSSGVARYNLNLTDKFEYSCIKVRVWYLDNPNGIEKPSVKLVRYCGSLVAACIDSSGLMLNVFFSIKIVFKEQTAYLVNIFGKETQSVSPKALISRLNVIYLEKPNYHQKLASSIKF